MLLLQFWHVFPQKKSCFFTHLACFQSMFFQNFQWSPWYPQHPCLCDSKSNIMICVSCLTSDLVWKNIIIFVLDSGKLIYFELWISGKRIWVFLCSLERWIGQITMNPDLVPFYTQVAHGCPQLISQLTVPPVISQLCL